MSPQSDKKQKTLKRVAEDNGVAIVVLDDHSREISVSNNNSICRSLTDSPDFASRCGQYCGIAFQKTADGDEFEYECYAGLTCKAVPVADQGSRFVAIIGRTFTSAEKYRQATDRAIAGDWREFPANEFFENVLINSSVSKISKAFEELGPFTHVLDLNSPPELMAVKPVAEREAKSKLKGPAELLPVPKSASDKGSAEAMPASKRASGAATGQAKRRAAEANAIRSLHTRLTGVDYDRGCQLLLDFIAETYRLGSLVWLECHDNSLVPGAAKGAFRETPLRIGVPADNARLLAAVELNVPLELRERVQGEDHTGRMLHVFPTVVGGEIRGAIGVEGQIDEDLKPTIMRLAGAIGPQVEILRLKKEAANRDSLSRATMRFTESLKRIDAADFWTHVTQISAELVQSERASLLIQSEREEGLRARAAIGAKIDLMAESKVGERVARIVLNHGKPVVVADISQTRLRSAPDNWQYKTGSFISYPIMIGDRRLAVMNFTDKAGGAIFEERDVEMLDAIAPQIAVALDRTTLKDMAGEFEQLSVTDALTGLLNRRYLEKRLNEEIQRSKRHRFPMSMMMLDVDDFKSYNDTFGHPAGDKALKIVASVLKDMLRGADVAVRFGGEEFAVLLPQTTSVEAAVIAERLRQRIEHTEFPKRKVTVSIGIASCSKDIDTPEDIVGAADHALYEAKNHGRNNVQIYDGYGKPLNEKIH
ncbi:MAG TPA: diguanylate cyclase [Pyrinomonadaceae bacterium]|nr:diguanylate cyclase [Pyrinomonadaceae bacterium]